MSGWEALRAEIEALHDDPIRFGSAKDASQNTARAALAIVDHFRAALSGSTAPLDDINVIHDRVESAFGILHPGDYTDDERHALAQHLWFALEDLRRLAARLAAANPPVAGEPPLDVEAFLAGLDSPNHSSESRLAWVKLFWRDLRAAAQPSEPDRLDVERLARAMAVVFKDWRSYDDCGNGRKPGSCMGHEIDRHEDAVGIVAEYARPAQWDRTDPRGEGNPDNFDGSQGR